MGDLIFGFAKILIATSLIVLTSLYLYYRLIGSKYFARRNIPYMKPLFLLGNFYKANFVENFLRMLMRYHLENKEKKILGFWLFYKPNLIVMDLDILKRILIRDFNNFRDRGIEVNVDVEPLTGHLFLMNGKPWRNLRVKLTPTFTSGKMKMMFPTIKKVGQQLQDYLVKPAQTGQVFEVKDLMARFTTDVISSCAFGIETNSLENPKSEFREFGRKIFEANWRFVISNLVLSVAPKVGKYLGMRFFPKDVSDFFIEAVRQNIDYREKTQTKRNDFLQLIIQLMRAGKIEDADKTPIEGMTDEELVQKFSLHEAAAQCFVFFAAGFETSSTGLTFCLYELARNPDIQKRLQDEIDSALIDCNNDITYEKLHEMEYMDMVVQETLRMYPPVGNLQRKCENDYRIPEMNVTIEKGMGILISVLGIHMDPEIYPEPEKFDPERFAPEERAKRHPCSFLPFGEGPRNCIGNRFGLMQMKTGLFYLLSKYNVEVTKTTPIPIEYDIRQFIPTAVGGMNLAFRKRTS
ncbi:UNVERIFIED_CONTAM: hypothetical protein PYX00_007711 [Menopon gallinae]|uniref:Cytochrome P450 n=1 Tax=Menopon gallinae TaxID=328185 RepID=A0AAW2HKQ3_9NEOP